MKSLKILFSLLLFFFILSAAYSQGEQTTGTWRDITEYEPTREVIQGVLDNAMGVAPQDGGEAGAEDTAYEPTVVPAAEGSPGARLVNAAADLVMRYRRKDSFPYSEYNVNPRVGCALMVNAALDAAGMGVANDYITRVRVVRKEGQTEDALVDRLLQCNWVQTSAPPYQAGDIITWNTTGNGVSGEAAQGTSNESHIGIIMASGDNVMAMSNSSSHHRPRIHPADYSPQVRVLRYAG
jgi:hypothetical protein